MAIGMKIFRGLYASPFRQAKVFLSHSWGDNCVSDRLYKILSQEFSVYYDRAPLARIDDRPFVLGESVVPTDVISTSDYFLFLASATSTRRGTNAMVELEEALGSSLRQEQRIGIIALEEFNVPRRLAAKLLYLRLRLRELETDVREIVFAVSRRLAILGGIGFNDGTFTGANDPRVLVERLHSITLAGTPTRRSLYPLCVGIPKYLVDGLLTYMRGLSDTDRHSVLAKLLEVYLWGKAGEERIARTNAVYILSRLAEEDVSTARAVIARPPQRRDPFSYRSFLVALSFMGVHEPLDAYAQEILSWTPADSRKHNAHNRRYHLYHYGSSDGALINVRRSLKNRERPNLLSLNVATLASMSSDFKDTEFLEANEDMLTKAGVERPLLRHSLLLIWERARKIQKGMSVEQRHPTDCVARRR
jgi:hypothetical protein